MVNRRWSIVGTADAEPTNPRTHELTNLSQELYFSSGDEAWLEPLNFAHHGCELAIGVFFIVRNGDHAQARALPEIVIFDLGNSDVELSEAVLDAP